MRPVLLTACVLGCGSVESVEAPYEEIPWAEQDQRGEGPIGWTVEMPEAGDGSFTLLSANVGNVDVNRCGSVKFKLCTVASEREIAARIGRLDPDVVLLQEVLPPSACDDAGEIDERHVCHPASGVRTDEPQIQRLLGDAYEIACEPTQGYECIGVHRRVGTLEGPVQTSEPVEGCDDGFTLATVPARLNGTDLLLTSAHPKSGFADTDEACRRDQIRQVLETSPPRMILGGDLNLDPYRTATTAVDVALWRRRVSSRRSDPDRPFAYHSGIAERDPPYWSLPLVEKTFDHVISTGFVGRCLTLGGPAGYPPLDSNVGEDGFQPLDHHALWCTLSKQ